MKKKIISLLLTVCLIMTFVPMNAYAEESHIGPASSTALTDLGSWGKPIGGRWTETADGRWKFSNYDGVEFRNTWGYLLNPYSKMLPSSWFYFDENGYMVTGFRVINGQTYFFEDRHNDAFGSMLTGWQQIRGVWYYFLEAKDMTGGALTYSTTNEVLVASWFQSIAK